MMLMGRACAWKRAVAYKAAVGVEQAPQRDLGAVGGSAGMRADVRTFDGWIVADTTTGE